MTEFVQKFVDGWQASTFGGRGQGVCVAGTQNEFQRVYETDVWGCNADGTTRTTADKWYMGPARDWMAVHYEVPVILSVVYLVVVYGLRYLMSGKDTKPFDLRVPLIIWNFLLAAFSIAGALYVVPAILSFTFGEANGNLIADMCTVRTEAANPWVFYFILSKIPELIDTLFLALRKKPIIFLHTYHHVATMLYCWDAWTALAPAGGPFAAMNLIVHSIMYSYYMIMAAGIRMPSWVSFIITSLQIIQMFGGMAVLTLSLNLCPTSNLTADAHLYRNYILGLAMYISYAFLFIKLFAGRYLFPSKRPAPAASAKPTTAAQTKPKAE